MILRLLDHTIFAFSDTHGVHRELLVPEEADIIICAGDAVEDDLKAGEYNDFIDWFSSLPAKWKIFVPGNHELSFELEQSDALEKKMTARGITILQDAVEDFDGVIIGSISGNFIIADENIPKDLDILVTHIPPYGILDEEKGSPEILNFVLKARPKYHLFGHIHTAEGQYVELGQTHCENIGCSLISSVPRLQGPAGKFLPGIRRWIKEGALSLNGGNDCERLNVFLHIIEDHPAYFFFDEDFNGQSREFVESSLNLDLLEEPYQTPSKVSYSAVKIDGYSDVLPYAKYAPDWCIILFEEAYKEHTHYGRDTFYFLERSDMSNIPRLPGIAFPKDDYGLSLIAVCVSPSKEILSITSRWNYGDDQDFFLSTLELERIVGEKIFKMILQ